MTKTLLFPTIRIRVKLLDHPLPCPSLPSSQTSRQKTSYSSDSNAQTKCRRANAMRTISRPLSELWETNKFCPTPQSRIHFIFSTINTESNIRFDCHANESHPQYLTPQRNWKEFIDIRKVIFPTTIFAANTEMVPDWYIFYIDYFHHCSFSNEMYRTFYSISWKRPKISSCQQNSSLQGRAMLHKT